MALMGAAGAAPASAEWCRAISLLPRRPRSDRDQLRVNRPTRVTYYQRRALLAMQAAYLWLRPILINPQAYGLEVDSLNDCMPAAPGLGGSVRHWNRKRRD